MPAQVIAIDGPSASGKSTVARQVAMALGHAYVDSGALYRGLTWKALRQGVDPQDRTRLGAMTAALKMEFFMDGQAVRFRIDGEDPGQDIRGKAVNENVSVVAAVPEVRAQVVAWLRDLRRFGCLVMEGRDIGTAVFPDAEFKFYLDAAAEERARRRHAELRADDGNVSDVGESLKRRDRLDSTRAADPLKVAPGAMVVDSTRLSLRDVVSVILERVGKRQAPGA